jgi:hypothetical protein
MPADLAAFKQQAVTAVRLAEAAAKPVHRPTRRE